MSITTTLSMLLAVENISRSVIRTSLLLTEDISEVSNQDLGADIKLINNITKTDIH